MIFSFPSTAALLIASILSTVRSNVKRHIDQPNILMIGAMKAGTTSLSNLMRSNPAICDYGEKEKHFFNGGAWHTNYAEILHKYKEEFSGCKAGQLTLDSTPGYSADPNVLERMKETYLPDVLSKKLFIYLVREPVSRHYSEYQMEVRLCLDLDEDLKLKNSVEWRLWRHERACENVAVNYNNKRNDPAEFSAGYNKAAKILSFHDWCLSNHGRVELRRGHYKDVILRYLEIVRRNQFFIVNFDHLIANTGAVMAGMSEFLGIAESTKWKNDTTLPQPKKSSGKVVPTTLDCVTVKMLEQYFRRANGDGLGADVWIRNMTASQGRAKGEVDFGSFSDPFKKCVNNTSAGNVYPPATWTFVEDSDKLLQSLHHPPSVS